MNQTAVAATVAAPPLPWWSRVIGILFSPRETFASLVAHPRWLDMLILTTMVAAAGMFWFLSTPVGERAMVDQQIAQSESWGQNVTDEMVEGVERMGPMMKWFTLGAILVGGPIFTLIVAAILLGYGAILGGGASFKQVLAIVTHAGVPGLIQTLVVVPLNYMRETMTSATSLAAFLPMVAEDSFLGSLLGWIDLFAIWWLVLLAIGLSVLYRRKTGTIALTLFALYLVIALAGTAIKMYFAGAS